jgi:Putative peptidoglycan binding domain
MRSSSLPLQSAATGSDVVELQIRLAGFRGTLWDGEFGPGTELQVVAFQRDYMGLDRPNGVVDLNTLNAIERFAHEFPIDFAKLRCPCGSCEGFGRGRFKGEYYPGKPAVEAYHKYEYPGIHKATLNSYRAAQFYAQKAGHDLPILNSGYRCMTDNEQRGRETTNHMGKALDLDFPVRRGETKRDDCERCDSVRGLLVEKCEFQIGWGANNRKALEPSNIAPSWIHMDVRCYAPKYLEDKFFVKDAVDVDRFDA